MKVTVLNRTLSRFFLLSLKLIKMYGNDKDVYQRKFEPTKQKCRRLRYPGNIKSVKSVLGKDFNSERESESYPPYQNYSYAAPDESTIDYESGTEFGRLIDGKNLNEFLSFIDEFFSQLLITYNPDLYNYAIRKLKE